jgi:protocatechuate 3,4-dioxygenase, alpha subunit
MSDDSVWIPAGSHTVGPFFRIGLDYLIERSPALTLDTPGTIEIRGRVLDRDGAPVPDAMLEFWCAEAEDRFGANAEQVGFPAGFRRAATNAEGSFSVVMQRPAKVLAGSGLNQAPHLLVLVFARGLLRHLIARVYLGDEPGNESDCVLSGIPAARRATLIARPDAERLGVYEWDVILQGTAETVFFAW